MLSLNFDPFPLLQTERLVLGPLSDQDAAALFSLRSDKKIMQFIDRPLAASIEDALELIKKINDFGARNEGITWGLFLKESSQLIGTIGYWPIMKEHYRAGIGYLLHVGFQGKGIMQEAMTAVLNYGFKSMGLHSIEASVNAGNAASIKLLERNKFIREAYFRESYYYAGQFLDSAIYSLLDTKEGAS